MCLAILQLPGSKISRRELREAFRCNDDGAGFMYNRDGELIIRKGFFSFRSFYSTYRNDYTRNQKSVFVIHFRAATHGNKDKLNCHPFRVKNEVGFVHNGILSGYSYTHNLSDTALFNINVLQNLPKTFMFNKGIVKLLNEFCDNESSKMVILDGEGNYLVLNETEGHWRDGAWFSGYSYAILTTGKNTEGGMLKCDCCREEHNHTELTWVEEAGALVCDKCIGWKNFCTHCQAGTDMSDGSCSMCGQTVGV